MSSLKAVLFLLILNNLNLVLTTFKPPHIIFILVDDLGWNDVGFNGAKDIETPNIDSLAIDGLLLNHYYVTPMCTPSRASLMTGRYTSNIGMQHKVIRTGAPWGLPLELHTLPEYLKDIGYVTNIVGKWHLGSHMTEYTPTKRGFDYHYGYWASTLDYYTHKTYIYVDNLQSIANISKCPSSENLTQKGHYLIGDALMENMNISKNQVGRYSTDIFKEKAETIILNHSTNKPLFLYISPTGVHRGNLYVPIKSPKKYNSLFNHIENENRKQFAGALKSVDELVGKVFRALHLKNMLSETIFILTSDNGADVNWLTKNGGSNWPLRGQKNTAYEGGVKAVGLIWSPKIKLKGHREFKGLMHITDWLPTLYAAAGGNPKNVDKMDGHNLWDYLGTNQLGSRKDILLDLDPIADRFAFRSGQFKIISGQYELNLNRWFEKPPSGQKSYSHNSIVKQVLKSYYKRNEIGTKNVFQSIDCGIKSILSNHSCNPEISICLFDLENDPCEYRNLAHLHPKLVSSLLKKIEYYRRLSISPLNVKIDPESNPSLYGGIWVPWKDKKFVQLRNNFDNDIRHQNLCKNTNDVANLTRISIR